MVTADRPQLMKRAIHCFNSQTYPHKELIVVDDGKMDLSPALKKQVSGEFQYIKLDSTKNFTLGELRNISLDKAEGDFLVQWDDDDWYHPQRLDLQAAKLEEGYDACCLPSALMHLDTYEYMKHPYIGALPDGIPGSIMHVYHSSIRYPSERRGEDTVYLKQWKKGKYSRLPEDYYYLFIRCFHGANTWEKEHFLRRTRNTPIKWLQYAWYRYLKADLYQHPVFQLHAEGRKAFEMYLADSKQVGLL